MNRFWKPTVVPAGIAVLMLAGIICLRGWSTHDSTRELREYLSSANGLTAVVSHSGPLQALARTYPDFRRFAVGGYTSFEVEGFRSPSGIPFMVAANIEAVDKLAKLVNALEVQKRDDPSCMCLGDVLLQFHCADGPENIYVKSGNLHLRIPRWKTKGDTHLTPGRRQALEKFLVSVGHSDARRQLASLPLGPAFPGRVLGHPEQSSNTTPNNALARAAAQEYLNAMRVPGVPQSATHGKEGTEQMGGIVPRVPDGTAER